MNIMAFLNTLIPAIMLWIPAILGLSILTGFTGLFSFGHAGFIAIGAYVSAICTKMLGFAAIPFGLGIIPAMLVGALAASLVGFLLGSITLKLKGDYFCLATIAFGEIIRQLISNISFIGDARGMQSIAKLSTLPMVLLIDVALVILVINLVFSRHGRNMVAVREEELAAQMAGVNVFRYKMIALIASAALAAVSGALFAHLNTSILPKDFLMDRSTELTIIVILGGIGSLSGSLIAAIVMLSIPEFFRDLAVYRLVLYGAIVVFVMISRPKGLMGGVELTPQSIRTIMAARKLRRLEKLENAQRGE